MNGPPEEAKATFYVLKQAEDGKPIRELKGIESKQRFNQKVTGRILFTARFGRTEYGKVLLAVNYQT